MVQAALTRSGDDPQTIHRTLGMLARTIEEQATVMTFNDLFFVFAVALVLAVPLVFFMQPLPSANGGQAN